MDRNLTISAIFVALLLLTGSRAIAQEADQPSLRIDLTPIPSDHSLGVRVSWTAHSGTLSTLAIAESWAYVQNPIGFLHELSVTGANEIEVDGNQILLTHEPRASLSASYTVKTGFQSFDWSRHYVPVTTHRFFHGIGQTFLLVPQRRDRMEATPLDAHVNWHLPPDWTAVTSFGVGKEVVAHVTTVDLQQSVFLAGPLEVRTGLINGTPITVAIFDLFMFDVNELFDLASSIIDAECEYMREDSFPPFVVTAIPVGDLQPAGSSRFGGTGLYRSVALFLPPASKMNDDLLYLFAHELFHLWNGRILEREPPEELVYWMSEGFTDYFAYRILMGAFPEKRAAIAERMNRAIERYLTNPSIHATNDEIRNGFWDHANTLGQLPYQRGLMAAIRWEAIMRERGIEDAMGEWFRSIVARARRGAFRLSNQSIRADGVSILGDWFGDEFDRFIDRGHLIELPDSSWSPYLSLTRQHRYSFELGFDLAATQDSGTIVGLKENSAAANAGLREGDRLAGWNIMLGDTEREATLKVRRPGEPELVEVSFMPRSIDHTVPHFAVHAGPNPQSPEGLEADGADGDEGEREEG